MMHKYFVVSRIYGITIPASEKAMKNFNYTFFACVVKMSFPVTRSFRPRAGDRRPSWEMGFICLPFKQNDRCGAHVS